MMELGTFCVGFILFIAATIIEMVLWLTWNAAYFRSGLVIFRREYPLIQPKAQLDLDQLQQAFRSLLLPPLVFRRLTDCEYAFREGFGLRPIGHSSLMHGLIHIDPLRRVLSVQGRMLWFNVLLPAFAIPSFAASGHLGRAAGMCAGFLAIEAIIYGIQASRFSRVAAVALDQLTASVS